LKFGIKPGLERIDALLEALGNPQQELKTIHVAGTNGKGSTTAMTAAVLMEAGYHVGVYTSPHLVRINERFKIDEREISDEDFAEVARKVFTVVDELEKDGQQCLTQFEILTAMGFLYFHLKKVDFAIIEVGLGGRFDATNVIVPVLAFITSISFDHTEILGDTIGKIAAEKAGIIKPEGLVAVYPQHYVEAEQVIRDKVEQMNSRAVFTSGNGAVLKGCNYTSQRFDFSDGGRTLLDVELGLIGDHQIRNAANVLNGLFLLAEKFDRIDEGAIRRGLRRVQWACRLSVLETREKKIILTDGAHNKEGLESLSDALERYFGGLRKVLLIGMLKDKEHRFATELFRDQFEAIVVTEAEGDRKLAADEFKEEFKEAGYQGRLEARADWEEAVKEALKLMEENSCDMICICGSLYITGYLLDIAKKYV